MLANESATKFSYCQKRIEHVSRTFAHPRDPNTRLALKIANTVKDARLYRLCYCQTGQEMRDDYYEFVYDNSFARRRRRRRY